MVANIEIEKVQTGSGGEISATFYSPVGEIKGAVLIVPAMGTMQRFYAPFATWLMEQGYLVATFDYSGTGQSQHGKLRDLDVTIDDWARFDCAAMVDAISTKAAGNSLYWVGHSLGGQILGMVPNFDRVDKAITIACGSGYWLENVPSLRWRAWWLWFVVVPLATKLCGYFPGKRLRKVGDLPAGVIRQWRKWCLDPEYLIGIEGEAIEERYKSIPTPICSLSFSDDELMSKRNIDSLHGFYASSPRKMTRISPADIGASRIGHFGFFKARFEKQLWGGYLLAELDGV